MPIEVGDLKLYDVEELSEMLHIQDNQETPQRRFAQGQEAGRKWYISGEFLRNYFKQSEPESHN